MRKHIFMLSFAICFIIITLFSNNNYEKKFEGEILFTSERDGNWEIYIMNADGSDIKRLTNNNAMDYSPSWSPDGKQIVFNSNRNGNMDIFVMDRNGENVRCLTEDNPTNDIFPDWSPVSETIVFASERNDRLVLYTINVSGEELKEFYKADEDCYSASWSPDGEKLAFARRFNNDPEICIINSDGSGFKRLTFQEDQDVCPSWSPDGKQIVYSNSNRGSGEDISLMNSDGSDNKVIIRNYGGNDFVPTFSPDGKYIAYQTVYGYDDEIAYYNLETKKIIRVTHSRGWDSEPRWRE